jgi:hypothetical protein
MPGCLDVHFFFADIEPAALELLREGAKADLVAASLGEALKLCIEATGVEDRVRIR